MTASVVHEGPALRLPDVHEASTTEAQPMATSTKKVRCTASLIRTCDAERPIRSTGESAELNWAGSCKEDGQTDSLANGHRKFWGLVARLRETSSEPHDARLEHSQKRLSCASMAMNMPPPSPRTEKRRLTVRGTSHTPHAVGAFSLSSIHHPMCMS